MPDRDNYHTLFEGASLADLRRECEALSQAAATEPTALASFLRNKVDLLRSAAPENAEAHHLARELERRLHVLNPPTGPEQPNQTP